MFKNGKLFGKINIYDAGVIILLLVLIICGMLKFKTFNRSDDTTHIGSIKYTLLVKEIRDYTINALQSGDAVYDTDTDVKIGTITDISVEESNILTKNYNGETINATNPYKNDLLITIETPGTVNDNGYYANRSIELKIGSEKKIETMYCKTTGKIMSLEYID